ncbi:sulfotransferase domain-containing protein [Candidatus Pelagibacter sp. Uisw_106]|uniref:sulfotransferase domain-containing protein n=1 Tax=Candidatus Pelagibacter sp. Uisw_106 TaxID=3230984 RepID=UPI0023361D83|nr:sulfotransferase domain-containing protein [Candidatus Pelagibacter sp.]
MIFWIASYPKSGNTWLRALISAYYYSKNGVFNQNILKNIGQFPEKKYLAGFDHNQKEVGDTARFWIKAQEKINKDKKLRFFKTHNIFGAVNNSNFSNKQNSAGCIYIVRDPRNVITSIKNHYELDDDNALKWMINSKKFIYDVERVEQYGYSDFQFISSWSINYKSWRVQKEMPIKIIRYEDLLKETYVVFKDVIEFINKTLHIKETINKDKLKNSVGSTFFDKLKNDEKNNGFIEAVHSKINKEKIPFFNLGPNNDWKKILDKNQQIKLNDTFEKDLIELGYK